MTDENDLNAVTDTEVQEDKARVLASLDSIIPNEAQADTGTENESAAAGLQSAADNLYGLISLAPLGLTVFGYSHTAAVFSESNNRALALACIPVFQKYGWGQSIIRFLETGAGAAEMGLIAVVWPLALGVQNALALDNAAKAESEKKAQAIEAQAVTAESTLNNPAVFNQNAARSEYATTYPPIDFDALKAGGGA